MASHGYTPGLPHEQQGLIKLSKEYQLISAIPGLEQGILRLPTPKLRTYTLDKQWKPHRRFPESNQFMRIDPTLTRPVLGDMQGSVFYSFDIAEHEQCARHEKAMKFLISGASVLEKDGLNLSVMQNLVEFQMTITDLHQHQAVTKAPRFDTLVEMEPPLVYLSSKSIYGQQSPMKSVDDFLPQAILINPNGRSSFVGSMNEIIDWLSVLVELYLPKGSARGSRQTMLVPRISSRGGTIKTRASVNETSLPRETLGIASLISTQKGKPMSTPRKKAKKNATMERNLYQKYLDACESFFSLMMEKNRDEKAAIKSFKRGSPEVEKLLLNLSSTIAGTGASVLLSVICIVASRRAQFTANFLTISVGVGLIWLSWAVYKLRETIVYIKKCPDDLGSEQVEEMIKKLDKSMNNIYRAAAITAATVLSLP